MVSYYLKNLLDTQYHILNENKIHTFEKLNSVNNFGVVSDTSRIFKDVKLLSNTTPTDLMEFNFSKVYTYTSCFHSLHYSKCSLDFYCAMQLC